MKIYGSIEKTEAQEDGTITVSGYASSEAVDSDGEIIKASAISDAIPDYMKFANIREMHDSKKAAGTALEMSVMDDGRTFLKAHIVDSEAVKKVSAGVYKGFSIGGKVTRRDEADYKIIRGVKLNEISLVDRPANPEAVFTFCKIDDAAEQEVAALENEGGSVAKEQEVTAPAEQEVAAVKEAFADKTDAATDLKKGMYGISSLSSILENICYLQESAEWEADYEKDGSGLPAALKAWLLQGGEILKAMVLEEVAELTGADKEVTADVIVLADKAKNLMKAACTAEEAEAFAKGLDTLISNSTKLAKAGARNSASDKKHINAIHKAAIALGADCGTGEKAAGSADDLQKMKTLEAENTELAKVCEALTAELKKFKDLPLPSKAIVKAVDKGADNAFGDTGDAAEKQAEPKSPQEALKKVWQGKPILV